MSHYWGYSDSEWDDLEQEELEVSEGIGAADHGHLTAMPSGKFGRYMPESEDYGDWKKESA